MTDWFVLSDSFSYWSLFFSALASSTILPGSSEALLVVYLDKGFQPLNLLLVATIGNTIGSVISWLMGYWLIKKFPDSMPKKISPTAIARIQHWGWPALFLAWLPVVGDPLCIAAGWLRINIFLSVLAITVGKLARYYALIFLFS